MNKKILIIAISGILILALLGFYYFQVSAINISVPKVGTYGSKMSPDYRNETLVLLMIQGAEDGINSSQGLLNQAREKDLSQYNFMHRQFLENMINLIEDRLITSKERLKVSKDSLDEGNYQKAGEYASSSSNLAATLPRHLNNILEGREKEDWNRVESIEYG